MIYGFTGNLGAGKTLSMTFIALMFYKNSSDSYKLLSNYSIEGNTMTVKSVRQLNRMASEMKGVMALDEVWAWADSRDSQNNETFNEFVLNSRKRGWDVLYTTQSISQIDKRLRENTDMLMLPEHYTTAHGDLCKINVFENNPVKHVNTIKFRPESIYDLYDTDEEVSVKNKSQEYDRLKEKYREYAEKHNLDTKKSLKSKIYFDNHDISKSDADMLASLIIEGL